MFGTFFKTRRRQFQKIHHSMMTPFIRSYSSFNSLLYKRKKILDKTVLAFHSLPSLQFSNAKEFQSSDCCAKLYTLFDNHFSLNRYNKIKVKTILMKEALEILGLESIYSELIDEDKYLTGIHGASMLSLPYIIPCPTEIKQMPTFHNPCHGDDTPKYFFYGDNPGIAIHYSDLNSICTETIMGDSDPDFYPDRIGVLGFIKKNRIDQLNNDRASSENKQKHEIVIAETIAWGQRHGGVPDNFKIGNELRVPAFYHAQISNLLVFRIKGSKRQYPLDQGTQYHNDNQCRT